MSPRRDPNEDIIGGEEVPRELEWAREMGAQSADIESLKEQISILRGELAEMRKDMIAVREMLANNKGGITTLVAVAGIAATLSAAIAEIIHWWHR